MNSKLVHHVRNNSLTAYDFWKKKKLKCPSKSLARRRRGGKEVKLLAAWEAKSGKLEMESGKGYQLFSSITWRIQSITPFHLKSEFQDLHTLGSGPTAVMKVYNHLEGPMWDSFQSKPPTLDYKDKADYLFNILL